MSRGGASGSEARPGLTRRTKREAFPTACILFVTASTLLLTIPASRGFSEERIKVPAALLHTDTFTSICSEGIPPDSGRLQASLEKLRAGGVRLVGAAIWVPPASASTPGRALEYVERVAACIRGFAEKRPDEVVIAADSATAFKALAGHKIAMFISVEGGDALLAGNDAVRRMYAAGVRSISLTWNRSNALAASSGGGADFGLTKPGRDAIKAMNTLGIMVDVSHASDGATDDILKVSAAPVFASHSNCRSLAGGRRNLPDRQIAKIGHAGGVVGLSFHSPHLADGRGATIRDAALHAACIKKAGGVAAVALGSDFDGRIKTPRGLEDASLIQALKAELGPDGFTGTEIEGVLFNNFIRFWRSVEGGGHGKAQ